MRITDTIKYVGVNDHKVDLFEGQYPVANGMAYNSYVILDEKIAVMDTVDANFTHEWLDNLEQVLDGRKPDYLIVQHMEPDHAANVANFLKVYPDTTVVANVKTFQMIYNFLTGEYAYLVSIAGLIVGFATLYWGSDMNGFVKTIILMVCLVCIVLGTPSFISAITGKGALIA